jgi:hypothetical protein
MGNFNCTCCIQDSTLSSIIINVSEYTELLPGIPSHMRKNIHIIYVRKQMNNSKNTNHVIIHLFDINKVFESSLEISKYSLLYRKLCSEGAFIFP